MADDSSSSATGDPNSQKPEPTTPFPNPNLNPTPNPNPQKPEPTTPIPIPNPNPNPNPSPTPPPPQQHSQQQVSTLIQPIPPDPPYVQSQIPGSLVSNLLPPPPFRPGMQMPTPTLHGSDPANNSASTDGLARLLPADIFAGLGFAAQGDGSNSAPVNGLEAQVNGLEASLACSKTASVTPLTAQAKALNSGAWSKKLDLQGLSSLPTFPIADLDNSHDSWPSLSEGVNASNKRQPRSKTTITHLSKEPAIPPSSELSRNRFPWAAKMNPATRNLYRATEPTILEDGTAKVIIPSHVFQEGLDNQREYIIGQFYRCSAPSGGLTHAVVNRIWGRNCKIFTKRLSDSTYLFHIPNATTRSWVLQRGLWHVDDCLMFVAQWTPTSTLELPEITTIPVWVTLRNIPASLYSIKALSWIASGVGEPMLSYKPRLDPMEMGKAKVMVEVELSKPFPQKVSATDDMGKSSLINVEYDWIPSKCKGCGQLGHKLSRCLYKSTGNELPTPMDTQATDKPELLLLDQINKNAPMTNPPSTQAEITSPESPAPKQAGYVPIQTKEQPTATSMIRDATKIVPPSNKEPQIQDVQQYEVTNKGTSSMDSHTTTENEHAFILEKDQVYSSSDESTDLHQQVEETLLRKSSRDQKPTLKAREMQRSVGKGRRGKGRRGRGHR